MKSITQLLLLSTLLGNIATQVTYAETQQNTQNLLILGDSLSAGYGIEQGKIWTDILQKRFDNHKIQISNASISGDTSANGLVRLPQALKQHKPKWLLIELGANDGLRGLSLSHIRKNLQSLIKLGLESGAEVLLMEIKIPPNYGRKYTQLFNKLYHQLAEQHSLKLLPFLLDDIVTKTELMQSDGLHPNGRAQRLIADKLWQQLKPILN